jgi:pimeloyl-ACP methyl ester carboxylesterase
VSAGPKTDRIGLADLLRPVALAGALAFRALTFGALAAPSAGAAQELKDVQVPTAPLVLKSRGSFMVGGESVAQTPGQLSSIFGGRPAEGGHVTVNQMYVEFMVPAADSGVPVVMLHGATLSGKTYDTTPDGRMGWYEYFVRRGHPVYVPDQVSRGRSGVDLAVYNDVRAGVKPVTALPNVFRQSDEINWTVFRFGPRFGTPFPDEQFPVAAAGELARQAIPDLNATLASPNPNFKAMAGLAARLNGAVLMGHSETGALPLDAALTDPSGVRGLILVEPGFCRARQFTDQQIATLAAIPILVVFGDHLDVPTGMPGFSWQNAYDDCKAFVARVNAARGAAEMLYPPDLGIRGNSHMIMQDRNNLQIADLILRWIDRRARAGGPAPR